MGGIAASQFVGDNYVGITAGAGIGTPSGGTGVEHYKKVESVKDFVKP